MENLKGSEFSSIHLRVSREESGSQAFRLENFDTEEREFVELTYLLIR